MKSEGGKGRSAPAPGFHRRGCRSYGSSSLAWGDAVPPPSPRGGSHPPPSPSAFENHRVSPGGGAGGGGPSSRTLKSG